MPPCDVGEPGRQVADQRGAAVGARLLEGGCETLTWSRRLRRRASPSPKHSMRGAHVLVAAADEVDQDRLARAAPRRAASAPASACADSIAGMIPSVRAEQRQRVHRLGVGDRQVRRPAVVGEVGVLRADARVVEAGRDRVRLDGLAVLVLEHERAGAVQHAALAGVDGRGVPAGLEAVAAGLEAVDRDVRVVEERGEQADRVRAAADAGGDRVRQPAVLLEALGARLVADAAAEVADHARERVRAGGGAEEVRRVVDARDPVAQRLVDRVLEGGAAGVDRRRPWRRAAASGRR